MLNLPIYTRNHTYYLHTRVDGRQFKRSLKTTDKTTAIIRASKWLEYIKMSFDFSNIKKYQIDLKQGFFQADGVDDHKLLLEAVEAIKEFYNNKEATAPVNSEPQQHIKPQRATSGLTLTELLDKYILLKKLKPASVVALKNTVKEVSVFLGNGCYINDILKSDLVRYQEHLAENVGNSPRTIDSKIGYMKSLFNFAIKQGYTKNENPAEGLTLLTKQQKLSGGYAIFEDYEIKQIFSSQYFKDQKQKDPDYYYCLLLGLVSGCRVNEITSLIKEQIQQTDNGTYYITIRDSKTNTGKREVPLPTKLFTDYGFDDFIAKNPIKHNGQVFKYGAKSRTGKGAGNAVGKKFARHLQSLGITRGKLVFHSLRKYLNDHMMKQNVEYEPRCQFFGHSVESVNVATYTKKYSVDKLYAMTGNLQDKLLM